MVGSATGLTISVYGTSGAGFGNLRRQQNRTVLVPETQSKTKSQWNVPPDYSECIMSTQKVTVKIQKRSLDAKQAYDDVT